ncbi:3-oxoacyl-[acyl-carrier-protein] reductase FabG-like [Battus philenor]|uniref:3-oxoacyl-[acyl-carrier-protein] reductase FabG-like n=1 Tax=Battus philenor TaxID=42288 RepID=UPI0035D12E59
MDFDNKVVLITGAASGIGAATAKAFAKLSAKLCLIDINEEELDNVVGAINRNDYVMKFAADLTIDDNIRHAVDSTIERFGRLDVLVNCAGIFIPTSFEDTDLMTRFDKIFSINLRAIVALVHQATPALIKTKGSIVNISSVLSSIAQKNYLAYSVCKSGLAHFTKCAAIELLDKGVRVNCISPGTVDTNIYQNSEMSDDEVKTHTQKLIKHIGMERMIKPEEVAELIIYLSSDKAACITGSDYVIDGGLLLRGVLPFERH